MSGGLVPPPPATADDFPVLDALRAVGALCVLTTHVAFWSGNYTGNGTWGTLLARLDVGVAIFFVLSGFLLSRPWLAAAADRAARPRTPSYLWKRAVRILPLYVVTAALALALVHDNRDLDLGDRVAAMLMLSSTVTGGGFPAGLTHMWSLAVEVSFYLLLPLLMLVLVGRRAPLSGRRVASGLAALVAVNVWWHLDGGTRVGDAWPASTMQWLPAYLAWFALGIALAMLQVRHARGGSGRLLDATRALARLPGSCFALAGGLLLVSATPLAGPALLAAPTAGESLTRNLIYAAIGFLVVVTGVFPDEGRYADVMGHAWSRRLGWISYSIFCLHLLVLHLVMWSTGWPLFQGRGLEIWVLTLAGSLVAAELGYRLVERPALRLKDLRPLGRRRGSTDATSSPTSGTRAR